MNPYNTIKRGTNGSEGKVIPIGQRGPKPTQQTLEILRLCREGETYRSIAKRYGLSRQRVCEIALANGLRRQQQTRDGGTSHKNEASSKSITHDTQAGKEQ